MNSLCDKMNQKSQYFFFNDMIKLGIETMFIGVFY